MAIALKRVYEPASPKDGVRVLVDRLWPRGLSKEAAMTDYWLRDIAPSTELRQWYHANPEAWTTFRDRYLKELSGKKQHAALEKLQSLAATTRKLTMLYASRNEDRNNATVLKELLEGARKPPSSVGRGGAGRERIRKSRRQ
jgi:uncharacterized protein YeaO (DUF488 family)